MHSIFKSKLFYIFILIPTLLFCQKELPLSPFKQHIKDKTALFTTHPYFKKAQSFFIQNEWDSTLVYAMKELITTPNNIALSDYCYFFRGHSLLKKGLFKEAKSEFLKVSKEFDFQGNVKANLGSIALELYEFKKAIVYYKEIEKLPKKAILTINESNVKHNIGMCYLHLGKSELANSYLNESFALYEQQKDTLELISSYGNIANFYYEQYKDTQAIPYFEKAYQLARTTNDFISKRDAALNMAIIEENRKNYPKSIEYRKEFEKWKDSVNSKKEMLRVTKIEKQFALKEIGFLQTENKIKDSQRKTYLYSAIILLLLLVTSAYFYREKVKANKIINAQKEDLDELNAAKDKLFSIVSHDLRSSVNAIKTSNKKLVNKLETENLSEVNNLLQNNSAIVNGAYNLLDNLLNWAMLQTKQSYFEITKQRLAHIVAHVSFNYKAILADKEITFENKVAKNDIVFADQESLKIILRNLIDNAIKFSHSKGKIQIYTENEHKDFCHLIIQDEGIGMDNATREELLKETVLLSKKKHENIVGTGLGLQLCKSMIKKNNGVFSIESELGKGTKMIISLPKNLPNEPN